jgi:hypothetical protein
MIDNEAITHKIGIVLLTAVSIIILRFGWMIGETL